MSYNPFVIFPLGSHHVHKGPKKTIIKVVKTRPAKNKLVIALGPTPPPPTKKPKKIVTTTPKPKPANKELCKITTDPSDIFMLTIVRKEKGKTIALPPIILDNSKVSMSFWIEKSLGFAKHLKKWVLFGNKYEDNLSIQLTLHPSMISPLPIIYKSDLLVLNIMSSYRGRMRVSAHLIDIVGIQKYDQQTIPN